MIKPKVMIFIPSYNAERAIIGVLNRISKKVYNRVLEILLQDNCSTDNTIQSSKDYKHKHKWKKFTIVKNNKNLGYGGTKKKAFLYAIKKGYDIIIMIHADGQYPPEKFWDMIAPLEKGTADMTMGVRKKEKEGGMPTWKLAGNKFLTLIENTVLGMHLSEFHTGYKAYTTSSLRKIPFLLDDNSHPISSEIIIQYKIAGFRIKEIPIKTSYGKGASECSPQTSFVYGISVFKNLILYILNYLHIIKVKKFNIKKQNSNFNKTTQQMIS